MILELSLEFTGIGTSGEVASEGALVAVDRHVIFQRVFILKEIKKFIKSGSLNKQM